jgi:hypothetical protein
MKFKYAITHNGVSVSIMLEAVELWYSLTRYPQRQTQQGMIYTRLI